MLRTITIVPLQPVFLAPHQFQPVPSPSDTASEVMGASAVGASAMADSEGTALRRASQAGVFAALPLRA
jgi:hypothetical protein